MAARKNRHIRLVKILDQPVFASSTVIATPITLAQNRSDIELLDQGSLPEDNDSPVSKHEAAPDGN